MMTRLTTAPDAAMAFDEHMFGLYEWILERDHFDPQNAAESLGLAPDQISAAFQRLVELGLVRVDPHNSLRARAVDPEGARSRAAGP